MRKQKLSNFNFSDYFESRKNSLEFLWLEITPKCNLNCVHCYADSSPHLPMNSKMTLEKWADILDQAYSIGCRAMQFIGGEPTIHHDFIKLLVITKMIGYEFVEVFTNGINITNEMFELFVQHKVNLAFSVYSFSSCTHDQITQRVGSFNKTLSSIQKALSLGLEVRAGVISMEENKFEVEQTISFLNQIGVKNAKPDRIRGIGRGERNNTFLDPYSELCGACWSGKLVVDFDGNIFPCVFSRFNIVGNVEEGIKNILQKTELEKFRRKVYYYEECGVDKDCAPDRTCAPDRGCLPDRGCAPDRDCRPLFCIPNRCHPNCAPTCSPNCGPNCLPYCIPADVSKQM